MPVSGAVAGGGAGTGAGFARAGPLDAVPKAGSSAVSCWLEGSKVCTGGRVIGAPWPGAGACAW